jgi:hypothetical protein
MMFTTTSSRKRRKTWTMTIKMEWSLRTPGGIQQLKENR